MRYALYFTPPPEAPLTRAAAQWLGRDAFSGRDLTPPSTMPPAPGLSSEAVLAATAEPRLYGFHATLKAPFRLTDGKTEDELVAAVERFCLERSRFTGPRLALTEIEGFLALIPAEPSPALDRFAAAVVEAFEPFRARLSEAEIARRRPERLSNKQRANLDRWGYPYVFDEFRFHMTLTGSLPERDRQLFLEALGPRFAPLLGVPLAVDALALFRQPQPGAPFAVHAFAPLGGPEALL